MLENTVRFDVRSFGDAQVRMQPGQHPLRPLAISDFVKQ